MVHAPVTFGQEVAAMVQLHCRHECHWWELVWMTRRVVVGFLGTSSWGTSLVGFVLVVGAGLAVAVEPFEHPSEASSS